MIGAFSIRRATTALAIAVLLAVLGFQAHVHQDRLRLHFHGTDTHYHQHEGEHSHDNDAAPHSEPHAWHDAALEISVPRAIFAGVIIVFSLAGLFADWMFLEGLERRKPKRSAASPAIRDGPIYRQLPTASLAIVPCGPPV